MPIGIRHSQGDTEQNTLISGVYSLSSCSRAEWVPFLPGGSLHSRCLGKYIKRDSVGQLPTGPATQRLGSSAVPGELRKTEQRWQSTWTLKNEKYFGKGRRLERICLGRDTGTCMVWTFTPWVTAVDWCVLDMDTWSRMVRLEAKLWGTWRDILWSFAFLLKSQKTRKGVNDSREPRVQYSLGDVQLNPDYTGCGMSPLMSLELIVHHKVPSLPISDRSQLSYLTPISLNS